MASSPWTVSREHRERLALLRPPVRRLHDFARDFWQGERQGPGAAFLGTALGPAEAAFRLATRTRSACHSRLRWDVPPIPVVSVGNLVVGGTGKTPVVRWLAEWFLERDLEVAIVQCGYGRDEALLHRRWFGSEAVLVDSDRRRAVDMAASRGRCVAILDDGFQHRWRAHTLSILLVAAEDPEQVRLLPRGPYREPLSAARRATHVLVTRRTAPEPRSDRWRERIAGVAPATSPAVVSLRMRGWRDMAGSPASSPSGDVLALCGVARPRAFAEGLARLIPGGEFELVAYPDHHEYTVEDVVELMARRRGRTIVCTEKDAVKLSAYPALASHCVVVDLRVEGGPPEALRTALQELVDRCAANTGASPGSSGNAG